MKLGPGLIFDKVKFSIAGRKFFHPYHVKSKQWTCLNFGLGSLSAQIGPTS